MGGKQRTSSSRAKQLWQSVRELFLKKRPLHKASPQSGNPPITDAEIIIALMGLTGAGKSYFIREVTGNPEVKVSDDLYSCTKEVQSYSFECDGARITLVDTPGFNDTERSDTEVLKEIADWTTETYTKEQLLSGIIYLHPITHSRMEGSAMRNLRLFQSLCGQGALKNVFLTTTQWSNVDPADAEFRETRLQNQDFWGGLIGKGATLQRFHGTKESGLELIRKMMSNTRRPLGIQNQIVKEKKTLRETDAGIYINEELIAQEKMFEEKLESLKKEFRGAIDSMSDEMKALTNKLDKVVAGMKFLEELHEKEVKAREAREREEEERRRDRGVIAVATQDISYTVHTAGVFTSYKTSGRLILDVNNHQEFMLDAFEITINYQPSPLSGPRGYKTTNREVFAGIGDTSYIVLDGVHYRWRPGNPIRIGSQEFVIFGPG